MILREGLSGRGKRPSIQVVVFDAETGRGVVAKESIPKRSYVCEYKTSAVYPVKDKADRNDSGSYTVETYYAVPNVGRLCFDATERYHHPGRYINHVSRGGNLRLSRPFFIRGKWRIGFLAIRDISVGDELCYDYLDRDREQRWLQEGRLVDGRVVAGRERGQGTLVTLNPPDNMMLTADQSHMASASAVSDEHSSKSLIAPMALTDRKRDADIDEKHEEVQEYGKDNVDEYEEDLEYVEDDEEDQDYVEEKEEDLDYVEENEEDVEYVEESDEGLEYVEENDEGLEYVEENEEYVEDDMEYVEEFSGSVVTPMAMTRKETRIVEEYDEDKEGFANSPMSGGMMENDSDLVEVMYEDTTAQPGIETHTEELVWVENEEEGKSESIPIAVKANFIDLEKKNEERKHGLGQGMPSTSQLSTVARESDSEKEDEGSVESPITVKEGVSFTNTKQRKRKRRYVWCPIEGCMSGPVQKITQHLSRVHKLPPNKIARINTPDNRRYATQDAILNKTPCPSRQQRTLESLLQRHPQPSTRRSPQLQTKMPPPEKGRKGIVVKGKGKQPVSPPESSGIPSTRRMGYHDTSPFLEEFNEFLLSRAGGKRSCDAAAQLRKNVSKYLFFLDNQKVRPELLLKKKPLVKYLKVVGEGFEVGSSGLLQKLDGLAAALRFMRFSLSDEDDEQKREGKVESMMQFIKEQRKAFKADKTRLERTRLEDIAADPPDLNDTGRFLTCPKLTQAFLTTVDRILKSPSLTTRKQYRECLAVIAGRILYR